MTAARTTALGLAMTTAATETAIETITDASAHAAAPRVATGIDVKTEIAPAIDRATAAHPRKRERRKPLHHHLPQLRMARR